INLPAPSSNNSPVRLVDLDEFSGGGTINVITIPAGGTTGQALIKESNADYDTGWASSGTAGLLPTGGTTGQSLTKASNTNYDATWTFPSSAGVSSFNGRTGAVSTQGTGTGRDWYGFGYLQGGLQPFKYTTSQVGFNGGCISDNLTSFTGQGIFATPDI